MTSAQRKTAEFVSPTLRTIDPRYVVAVFATGSIELATQKDVAEVVVMMMVMGGGSGGDGDVDDDGGSDGARWM